MTGTLVNVGTVVAGSTIGLVLRKRLSRDGTTAAMQGVGLVTLFVGIQMAWEALVTGEPERVSLLPILLSLALGGYLGDRAGIEAWLERMGRRVEEAVERRWGQQDGHFARAFVASSLLFVVGPMTVVGSFNDGMFGDYRVLLTKAVMDGIASTAFAATLGPGVLLSAGTILVYQGALTAAGAIAGRALDPVSLAAISAAGGLVIAGIGFNLLEAARVRTGNLLPALALAPLLAWLWRALGLP